VPQRHRRHSAARRDDAAMNTLEKLTHVVITGYEQALFGGRAGLEPATNGLWVPIYGVGDQAKQLATASQIACVDLFWPLPVRSRYACAMPTNRPRAPGWRRGE